MISGFIGEEESERRVVLGKVKNVRVSLYEVKNTSLEVVKGPF